MARCKHWDRLNKVHDRRNAGYQTADDYYWYELADHTGDDDPLLYEELDFKAREEIDVLFLKYLAEWQETEDCRNNPFSYYGVSR